MNVDSFTVPIVFFRIGWMDRYSGIVGGDTITGGGAYVTERGYGHEIFNFRPFQNKMFGYLQPSGRKGEWAQARINLKRLGVSSKDPSISGVLAVWVATAPPGGGFIIGWYANATVFRSLQPSPLGSERQHAGEHCGYYVTASTNDAVVLPPDERVFSIPQKGKGGFGQSNVWYADEPLLHADLRQRVLHYIETRQLLTSPTKERHRRPDPLIRQQVERIAVKTTVSHYDNLGYHVSSVERDNVGWDLNARLDRRYLKLEVKGLSGRRCVVALTPNEYEAMKRHRLTYRLCVVTNALISPALEIFAYSPEFETVGIEQRAVPERRGRRRG